MKLVDVLRPALLRFPRPNMAMLGLLGAGYPHDPKWRSVQPRFVAYRDSKIKCIVSADLSEWGGRYCYYWGRFYDLCHQMVLEQCLQQGDSYVDIGANLGFQSLYASRLVGSDGQVISIEPNPDTYAILQSHIGINRIRHCRALQLGLSDSEGEMVLSQADAHSGLATLRSLDRYAHQAVVPVRTGDSVFADIEFKGRVFMKMDVEGFELRALRGLQETLARIDYLNVEVTPEWIVDQGGTAEELMRLMVDAGFRAYEPVLRWTAKVFRPRLRLLPLAKPKPKQYDVFFVREPLLSRLNHLIEQG